MTLADAPAPGRPPPGLNLSAQYGLLGAFLIAPTVR